MLCSKVGWELGALPRCCGSGDPNLPWGSAEAAALVLQGERWEGGIRAGPCPLLMQFHLWQELGGGKIPSPRGLCSAPLGCAVTAGAGEGEQPALLSLALGGRGG